MAFTVQNIFSVACRDRCMARLRTLIPIPSNGKGSSGIAAVMVPLCRVSGVPSLLYTVRSSNMWLNSGQISFPGGKCAPLETAMQTAMREIKEELGIGSEKIDIWGQGPPIPGHHTDYIITPVIGAIQQELRPADMTINVNEVSEAFAVPIEHLCDPKNQFYTQFSNGHILPVFTAEDYKIWGITAYITHAFLSSTLSKSEYQNEWLKKKIDLASHD